MQLAVEELGDRPGTGHRRKMVGLAEKNPTGTTVEGEGGQEGDGREETATEEATAKKAEASEQADGGSRR